MSAGPKKDAASVAPDGTPLAPLIDGVEIRHAVTQTDERGSICEILDPAWGFSKDPIVDVYELTIRPGKIKGWHVHHEQTTVSTSAGASSRWCSTTTGPTRPPTGW